jgi:hypothetical protein
VTSAFAHSWFSDYTTGRKQFEECCGYQDCHTAQSLGNPEIRRRDDGGYSVRLGKRWIEYDHPAVHTSHDSNTWICYLGEAGDNPDPLCIFFPAGIM